MPIRISEFLTADAMIKYRKALPTRPKTIAYVIEQTQTFIKPEGFYPQSHK